MKQEAALAAQRNVTRIDPWGNDTEQVLLSGAVNWHDDPTPVGQVYDRATMPAVHTCVFQGKPYFSNVALGASNVRNFTQRIEVVLEWDITSYTRDMLRVAYRPGAGGEYQNSMPGRNGHAIVLPVHWSEWSQMEGGAFSGDWPFYACVDSETGDPGVPPVFEGELRFRITAFKLDDLSGFRVK